MRLYEIKTCYDGNICINLDDIECIYLLDHTRKVRMITGREYAVGLSEINLLVKEIRKYEKSQNIVTVKTK